MELRRFSAILRRWWWLLALGMVVGTSAASLAFLGQTPKYEALGTVLVHQVQTPSGQGYYDLLANQQLAKTYSELVTAPPVLDTVARSQGLADSHALGKRIDASLRRETALIDITAHSGDPVEAATLVNETAKAFTDLVTRLQEEQRARSATEPTSAPPAPAVSAASFPAGSVPIAAQATPIPQPTPRPAGVTLVTPAQIPVEPSGPAAYLTVLLGAILGLLATGAIVAAAEYFDDTVKTATAVTQAAGTPVVGAITRFRRARRGGGRLLTSLPAGAQAAEAYRLLRLGLPAPGTAGQTLLITSAHDGEGKSTTAANLALALASTGQGVILVDADFQHATLHRLFGVSNTTGLSTLLSMQRTDVDDVLRPTPLPTLHLLPSGPPAPNLTELMEPSQIDRVLADLLRRADVVLFDSPSILRAADAAVWAARMDGVVLIAEWGRTRTGALTQAATIMRRAGVRIWGVVLNKLPGSALSGLYDSYPLGVHEDGAVDLVGMAPGRFSVRGSTPPNGRAPLTSATRPDPR